MYVKVRALAGAKKEVFTVESENKLKISVREKARGNMANKRICQLVAGHFGVDTSKVRIISGHHHPIKLISVVDE